MRVKNIAMNILESPFPIHIISSGYQIPEFYVKVGENPSFLLEKNGAITHVIINGFLMDLSSNKNHFKNAMIYR